MGPAPEIGCSGGVSAAAFGRAVSWTHTNPTGFLSGNAQFEDAASNTYAAGTTPGQTTGDAGAILLYQHSDHLTTRLTTDQQGNATNQQAHYPYGEDWYLHDTTTSYMFTSYPHEAESGNDYAIHRSHSCRLGRFTTADPVRGRIRNPQRLNRYAYVMGDPTNRRDPRGLDTSFSDDPESDNFIALIDNAGAGGGSSEGPNGFGAIGGWVGAQQGGGYHGIGVDSLPLGGGLFGGGLFGGGLFGGGLFGDGSGDCELDRFQCIGEAHRRVADCSDNLKPWREPWGVPTLAQLACMALCPSEWMALECFQACLPVTALVSGGYAAFCLGRFAEERAACELKHHNCLKKKGRS